MKTLNTLSAYEVHTADVIVMKLLASLDRPVSAIHKLGEYLNNVSDEIGASEYIIQQLGVNFPGIGIIELVVEDVLDDVWDTSSIFNIYNSDDSEEDSEGEYINGRWYSQEDVAKSDSAQDLMDNSSCYSINY